MNVLLSIPDLDLRSGGPVVLVDRLAQEMVRQGCDVDVICTAQNGIASATLAAGIGRLTVARAAGGWRRLRAFEAAIAGQIARRRPAVIHDFGLWLPENVAAMRAAGRHRLPLVSQPCGMLQNWPMRHQRLKKLMAWQLYQRRLVNRAAAVITTGAAEQAQTGLRLADPARLHHIPHGVDHPEPPDPPPVRERRAMYLGRLDPKKQVDLLLRAWARLRPAGWTLLIAGDGEPGYVRELHHIAQDSGLGQVVIFAGAVHGADKSALLWRSQLFLQPSLHENFGLAIAEAMAHGLPVLTTRETPWAELDDAQAGWTVAADESSVSTALERALALPAERLALMGLEARKLSAAYTWKEAARRTLALYAHTAGRSG